MARSGAGIVLRIHLRDFMCHSSLQIELGDSVNFITGQNGSGKSAILTALCVAFGVRAKGTQRASTLKDFIKTGCSSASIAVDIKNEGEDAFKHDIYGDVITVERRITESASTFLLKDHQGKKVAHRREDLNELVEHFNIDVENPCVIMSQDKSREFLHSGNDRDKFKFFVKATLLQQVDELLHHVKSKLSDAKEIIAELESSIRPIVRELDELQDKIKNMEHVEEIAHEVQNLKKKLAWSWVYDVDREMQEQEVRLEKLKERIPTCQARIDKFTAKVEGMKKVLAAKRSEITSLMEKTSEFRRLKDELQHKVSSATKERLELEEELSRESNMIQKMEKRVTMLNKQVHDFQEQHMRSTQAAVFEIEDQMKHLEDEAATVQMSLSRLQDEEHSVSDKLADAKTTLSDLSREIDESERKLRDLQNRIHELRQYQKNKVTAFGGERVLNLLQAIERHHRKFSSPPIGPMGAHVNLVNGESWAFAVECAIGKLLDAFIVSNHKDSLILRDCCKEANYRNLQIIIYDFSIPRLVIPGSSLPATNHPTTLSVISTESSTVFNVLVDVGGAERQVLVKDYEVGKSVAFDQRIQNLKEVYTSDGYRMFSRGSVQTTLPPHKRVRSGRLRGTFDDDIYNVQAESSKVNDYIRQCKDRKRRSEVAIKELEAQMLDVKRRRFNEETVLATKQMKLRDTQSDYDAAKNIDSTANVDDIVQEIAQTRDDIQRKELILEKIKVKASIADKKVNDLKRSFQELCDSAKEDIDAIDAAEKEISDKEETLQAAEAERLHYEGIMKNKVLPDIKEAETECRKLQQNREENYKKASIICSESEIEALGGCSGFTPEQLSAKLNRLQQRLQNETRRCSDSIDDLRALYDSKKRKISKKQQTYAGFHDKLNACDKALELRLKKFQRNETLLMRQLTWQFNGHLKKKGICGHIKVDYEHKVLSVEVKMPQDASGTAVRDTRGLSGGERSFSTLCFALALHEMTEAPFRAMDEFDVFMDAVSRKISLDTLVDFAVSQESQWIFITPHDISMVKPHEKVRKQQMAAPRG